MEDEERRGWMEDGEGWRMEDGGRRMETEDPGIGMEDEERRGWTVGSNLPNLGMALTRSSGRAFAIDRTVLYPAEYRALARAALTPFLGVSFNF
jgi:hypothetical protein